MKVELEVELALDAVIEEELEIDLVHGPEQYVSIWKQSCKGKELKTHMKVRT